MRFIHVMEIPIFGKRVYIDTGPRYQKSYPGPWSLKMHGECQNRAINTSINSRILNIVEYDPSSSNDNDNDNDNENKFIAKVEQQLH